MYETNDFKGNEGYVGIANQSDQYRAMQEKLAYAAKDCTTAMSFSLLDEMKQRRDRYIDSLNTVNEMIKFLEASPENQRIAEMLRRAI